MIRIFMLALSFVILGESFAGEGHKHNHKKKHKHHHHKGKKRRGHSAHVHGDLRLSMVAEKRELHIVVETPAVSLLGFEHKAKSDKEKKMVAELKKNFTDNFLSYLGPEQLSDCQLADSKFEQKFEGNHSAIYSELRIKCDKDVGKRRLSVALKSHYGHIDHIELNLIRHDGSVLKKEFKDKVFKIAI